eukprot:SM000020S05971  [mRNA]  locus=s20:166436:168539:- [translate_table: standard]
MLQEGRLDDKGQLQCSYHGWSFRGDGSCALIPQAAQEGPEARAAANPRACTISFPTRVSQGLLFVWPNESGWHQAAATEAPKLPPVFDDPAFSSVSIQRDLYYGYDTLMENVADPSHIDFAHHKRQQENAQDVLACLVSQVTGRRDRAKPLPFVVEESGLWGFRGTSDANPKISSNFQAPCYFVNTQHSHMCCVACRRIDLKVKLPFLGEKEWQIWICSFNVPMAPGQTRSIVISYRNFARWLMPGPKWFQVVPRWWEHMTSNLIYDGDMIVLQGQEKQLHSADKDISKDYGKLTFTPTAADRFVLAFRNWLRRNGGGEPQWAPGSKLPGVPLPSTTLSKREMMDREGQHTNKCSACRGALKGLRKLRAGLTGAAVLLGGLASLPADIQQRACIAGLAVACAGAAYYIKKSLEQRLIFVDYVHAHIED